MKTREKILKKALEMFNENGIEYVGMRELAHELNIRVSNITYYFPTKDDLVFGVAMGLKALNSKTFRSAGDENLSSFLNRYDQVFKNQYKYRCLTLSLVHLMKQNKRLAAEYLQIERNRKKSIANILSNLSENGYLKMLKVDEKDHLVSLIILISRFWLSESMISFHNWSFKKIRAHYLNLMGSLLFTHASTKGKQDLHSWNPTCIGPF